MILMILLLGASEGGSVANRATLNFESINRQGGWQKMAEGTIAGSWQRQESMVLGVVGISIDLSALTQMPSHLNSSI